MNRIARTSIWTIVFGLILLISVGAVSAQKRSIGPTLWEDTALNPHDFTNDFYEINGLVAKVIVDRRNGSDGLSIFGNSSNPYHTNVRVIATIPAYDQDGGILFWYPLGTFPEYGFTTDKIGWEARQMADMFPIYVFPHSKLQDFRVFANTRQAALMDNSSVLMGQNLAPVGFRRVIYVTFTEKAFTEEGVEMMGYMEKKNGMGADDTPILKTMDDLRMMLKHDLIVADPIKTATPVYGIVPMISDPTNGVIAKDAFLWFATKDGTPLPTEEMFYRQFTCLQKTGNWCKE